MGARLGSERWRPWRGDWGHTAAVPAGPAVSWDARVSSSVFILRDTKSWATAGSPQHSPSLTGKFPAGAGRERRRRRRVGGSSWAPSRRPAPAHLWTWRPWARSHRRGAAATAQPRPIVPGWPGQARGQPSAPRCRQLLCSPPGARWRRKRLPRASPFPSRGGT